MDEPLTLPPPPTFSIPNKPSCFCGHKATCLLSVTEKNGDGGKCYFCGFVVISILGENIASHENLTVHNHY